MSCANVGHGSTGCRPFAIHSDHQTLSTSAREAGSASLYPNWIPQEAQISSDDRPSSVQGSSAWSSPQTGQRKLSPPATSPMSSPSRKGGPGEREGGHQDGERQRDEDLSNRRPSPVTVADGTDKEPRRDAEAGDEAAPNEVVHRRALPDRPERDPRRAGPDQRELRDWTRRIRREEADDDRRRTARQRDPRTRRVRWVDAHGRPLDVRLFQTDAHLNSRCANGGLRNQGPTGHGHGRRTGRGARTDDRAATQCGLDGWRRRRPRGASYQQKGHRDQQPKPTHRSPLTCGRLGECPLAIATVKTGRSCQTPIL
jgi:hypothetical protein